MIFAKSERMENELEKVLIIGLTFDELRHMLENPGMTVNGFGKELDPDNQGALHVIMFAQRTNEEAKALLKQWMPKMPDV
jgi:hypothetical protein